MIKKQSLADLYILLQYFELLLSNCFLYLIDEKPDAKNADLELIKKRTRDRKTEEKNISRDRKSKTKFEWNKSNFGRKEIAIWSWWNWSNEKLKFISWIIFPNDVTHFLCFSLFILFYFCTEIIPTRFLFIFFESTVWRHWKTYMSFLKKFLGLKKNNYGVGGSKYFDFVSLIIWKSQEV